MSELDQSVNEQPFFAIPRDEVLDAIREHVKPRSKPSFSLALKKKIELNWPAKYDISPTNFQVAYERYLVYRNKFMKRYDFMKTNNMQNVPECRDGDDGLIGMFLRGINNFDYPKTLYGCIAYEERRSFQEPDGFQRFISTFYAHVKVDYDNTRQLGSSGRI